MSIATLCPLLTRMLQLDFAPKVAATKTAIGDEGFQQAMIKEPPPKMAAPILIISSLVAFCCSTANGYDGSLFGTLLSNEHFKNFFGVENAGIGAGALPKPSLP